MFLSRHRDGTLPARREACRMQGRVDKPSRGRISTAAQPPLHRAQRQRHLSPGSMSRGPRIVLMLMRIST